mmetsp:Transcript_13172/g.25567  ORF Transcript_13172/g.25567 Transcript_13172/m.25567 type:complete len:502 (+) Transcript_13172:74-1579(+)
MQHFLRSVVSGGNSFRFQLLTNHQRLLHRVPRDFTPQRTFVVAPKPKLAFKFVNRPEKIKEGKTYYAKRKNSFEKAKIKSVNVDGTYTVYFPEHGDSEVTVPLEGLRDIPKSLARKGIHLFVPMTKDDFHVGRGVTPIDVQVSDFKRYQAIARKFAKRWTIPADPWAARAKEFEFQALTKTHKLSFDYGVLLEVRDIRIPATSHHPSFTRLAEHRTHVIVYTHADRVDAPTADKVRTWTKAYWPHAHIYCCDANIHRVSNEIKDAFAEAREGILTVVHAKGGNCCLTVGIPNVGKSSFIAQLLKVHGGVKKKPFVQDKPGVTQDFTQYLLRKQPRQMLMDVPGITPQAELFERRPEYWYAMIAVGSVELGRLKDDIIEDVCTYVLFACNRDLNFQYVRALNLPGPVETWQELFEIKQQKQAQRLAELQKIPRDELTAHLKDMKRKAHQRFTPEKFLRIFNSGSFGPVVLDDISKKYTRYNFIDRGGNQPTKSSNKGWYAKK